MKQLLIDYVREVDWKLLPIWVSLGCISAWLAIITVFAYSEAGATQQELAPLMSIFEWLPAFFFGIPFFQAALGLGISRFTPSGWSL